MPRTYKPSLTNNRKRYDEQLIKQALNEYNTSNKSLTYIAKQYGISKSVLQRCKTHMRKPGGQQAIAPDVEASLVEHINVCSDWGYLLDTIEFRFLIKEYLDSLGLKIKRFKNNMPGPDYINYFFKRHQKKITFQLSRNVKCPRVIVTPELIEAYFNEVELLMQRIPLSNIINYCEFHLTDDSTRKEVIVRRKYKYPEKVMNPTKISISVMMSASADGHLLAPYVVYKEENVCKKLKQNGPKGCRYNCSSSGWFDRITFDDWVQTIVFDYFQDKSGTKILIGDNLSTHLSIDLISKCKKQDIRFIFLPGNSSHLTMPLDVAFFKPLESAWINILHNLKNTDEEMHASIFKSDFLCLCKNLVNGMDCNTYQNILAGFEKCGISPMNRNMVLSRLSSTPSTNMEDKNENFKEASDEMILSVFKEINSGTTQVQNSNKKNTINVMQGISLETVTMSEDLNEPDDERNMEEVQDNKDEYGKEKEERSASNLLIKKIKTKHENTTDFAKRSFSETVNEDIVVFVYDKCEVEILGVLNQTHIQKSSPFNS